MSAPSDFPVDPVDFLLLLSRQVKGLATAHRDSLVASDARAALPPGSSRAKVTSANARWSSCAEDRDRRRVMVSEAIAEGIRRRLLEAP